MTEKRQQKVHIHEKMHVTFINDHPCVPQEQNIPRCGVISPCTPALLRSHLPRTVRGRCIVCVAVAHPLLMHRRAPHACASCSHFLITLPRYVMCCYLTSRVQLRCAQPPRCSKVLWAHISRNRVPRAITLPPRASRPAFHAACALGVHCRARPPYTLPLMLLSCQAASATASSLALGFLDPDSLNRVLPLHSTPLPLRLMSISTYVLSVLRSWPVCM